ncbi:SGNH/GDSL hydrolase family protein [Mycobacterium yunnanensis]|uniref:SGNH/GDSL hydrolase family protein n=1 Tax=Mycobacterium yunnanensis TaxID=368477 RepID=A0A9X3BWG5_9MYCO|nr:SGNH/GDSL hydrolase family protein [Mycobacterium yunnanensis]MCV7424325.1 SGNH/GDSL hydrolase family protein [Mycobacterium yunnanensis]
MSCNLMRQGGFIMRLWAALLAIVLLLAACSKEPPPYESKYTAPETSGPSGISVAIIGDSYTSGSSLGGKGPQGWPDLAAKTLRAQGVDVQTTVGAEGGSGYRHPGNSKGGVFDDQVKKVVHPDDKLVVVFGSRNDSDVAPPELTESVQSTLADVKAGAPSAKVLVIGPAWVDGSPTPQVLQVRDIVRDQAAAIGATFYDPIAQGWFVGQPQLIGKDGIHPTDDGHAYMAEKIAPLIAAQLQPAPS